jgi:hypothetical protein
MSERYAHDVSEIQAVIEQLFAAICWNPGNAPDWETFKGLCLDDALLIPAARPARPTELRSFIEMMDEQRHGGKLAEFRERVLAHDVGVFGNVAVARSSFATSVNQGSEGRGVNAFMLIKNADSWRIAAMSWDNESEEHPIPADLS